MTFGAAVAANFCAFGAPTFGVVDGKYVVDVPEGAKVKFAAGTTIAVQDEDDIPHNTVKAYPILRVEEGGTLENAPAYARPRGSKWFAEWSADNTQLNLAYHDGFCILIR